MYSSTASTMPVSPIRAETTAVTVSKEGLGSSLAVRASGEQADARRAVATPRPDTNARVSRVACGIVFTRPSFRVDSSPHVYTVKEAPCGRRRRAETRSATGQSARARVRAATLARQLRKRTGPVRQPSVVPSIHEALRLAIGIRPGSGARLHTEPNRPTCSKTERAVPFSAMTVLALALRSSY